MSSIQERLQLKRVPLDTWNVREQLCLASAVVRSGDQNWMSVSRALKTIGEPNRPPDWYSQKSCAAQYGMLLENVETPKRKKRNSEGGVETPQESILKMLTQQRIDEIQSTLTEMNTQHQLLQTEISEVRATSTSDERIQEIWTAIETAKRTRERENARRAAWLKEREERRARAERTWRPPQTPPPTGTPGPPSSPLLTSLLKSSPVVTTPQHIPHPASIVAIPDAVSPSAGAPTLSLLLEQPGHTQDSKHAAIEHIKSQLVQIEHQLKANTNSPQPVPTPLPVPTVEIDDIEIKAEDVYAFRDIDIHIPPVASMHKGPARVPDKNLYKKEESSPLPTPETNIPEPMDQDQIKEEPVQEEHYPEEISATDVETPENQTQEEVKETEEVREATPPPEAEVRIAFPEVKFPTLEIKVIHSEDHKIKEEVKETEAVQPEEEVAPIIVEEPVLDEIKIESVEEPEEVEAIPEPPQNLHDIPLPDPVDAPPEHGPDPDPDPADIPLPPDATPEETQEETQEREPSPGPTPEPDDAQEETIENIEAEVNREEHKSPPAEPQEEQLMEEKAVEDVKKEEDAEDSIPLKEMLRDTIPTVSVEEIKSERIEEDTHTETDDDTPMELSREEEKDGKKRRDYSRKKKSDSRTCSGSESAAEASAPESPGASDERRHRLWRKSVMLVYSRLCAHKYASLFLRPISDEEAPGYSVVVKRPMDLTTIRRNIDAGVIRTTAEFQRDVLLMLSNALMYNSSSHSVYMMAREMHEEAQGQLGMLLAAQAHAGLCAPPRRKRRLERTDRPHT